MMRACRSAMAMAALLGAAAPMAAHGQDRFLSVREDSGSDDLAHSENQCPGGRGTISKEEVQAAQKAWGDAVVSIGNSDDPAATAKAAIKAAYAYQISPVLFKPTVAKPPSQFRGTPESALSYMVGAPLAGEGAIPTDKGFAMAPFSQVEFNNDGLLLYCDYAVAMGVYYFTRQDGGVSAVDYTFGYMKDPETGSLRINLHHSSLPYTPQ